MSAPALTRPPAAPAAPPVLPLAVAAGAVLVFSCMDATVKALPAGLTIAQIVALRFCFAVVPAGALVWRAGARADAASLRIHTLRGVLMLASTALFFAALRRLPFAETLALSFLAPLFMVLLAALLLGERLTLALIGVIAAGLAGVGVILGGDLARGGASHDVVGVACALGAAIAYAASMILLRRQAQRDRPEVIVLMQQLVPAVLSLPVAIMDWTPLEPSLWLVFAALGAAGVGAHSLITWAYARAPAGRLAVTEYTALLWAVVFGFVLFAEVPSGATLAGGGLILAACLAAGRLRH